MQILTVARNHESESSEMQQGCLINKQYSVVNFTSFVSFIDM